MTEDKDRGSDRADTARGNDDSETIEAMEDAPAFGGTAGGNLERDIGSRDELDEAAGDGITRVRDSDKPEEADLPRYDQK